MRLLSKTAVDFSILPGVFDGIADNIEYNLGQMGTVNIDIRICNLLMYGNSLVLFLNCRIEHDDAGVKTFFNVADAFFENDWKDTRLICLVHADDSGKALRSR